MRRNELPGRCHAELIFPDQMIDRSEAEVVERDQNIFQVVPPGEYVHTAVFLENSFDFGHSVSGECQIVFFIDFTIAFQNP